MNRRAFLTTVAGTSSIIISSSSSKISPSSSEESLSWSARADRGVRRHRTTDLSVLVVDMDGEPVPDADVSVTMLSHDFQFGTAVNAARLLRNKERPDPYRGRVLELFNTAVLKVRHKWKPWENPHKRAVADKAVDWLRNHGLAVRGHTAIWQNLEFDVVPDDVVAKTKSDDPDRSAYLSDRTTGHVRDIVGHYAGRLTDWDILNEHLDHHRITEAIANESSSQKWQPVAEWFRTADAVAPETELFVNDHNITSGGNEDRRESLETLVMRLQQADVPIDGVGIQGHFGSKEQGIDPTSFRSLLDRFASIGISLKVTEYDTFGEGWTEQSEADHLETLLKTLYSHPAAVGFLMWGFWDGEHWRDNAPLFREDWSQKPAYDVYTSLVFDEWWTDESGITDMSGRYQTRAFLGDYEISVTDGSQSATVVTSLTDSESETIVVRLA